MARENSSSWDLEFGGEGYESSPILRNPFHVSHE